MTDKFHVWFWNRRTTLEKFLTLAAPSDLLFVLIMQLAPVSGLGILFLTVFLTIGIGIVFAAISFVVDEYKKYQREKEIEAERIIRTLRGVEPKSTRDEELIDQLKTYHKVKLGK